MMLITLVVLAAAAVYFMDRDERIRLLRAGIGLLHRLAGAARRTRMHHRPEPIDDMPAPPWPLATLAIALLMFSVHAWMRLMGADLADGDTLVSWGANFGPRTANGEWWRLVTAIFVHDSSFTLLINLVALVPAAVVLERVIGRGALTAVYVSSGVVAGLVSVAAQPVAVTAGAAGAIFGLYGLVVTSWMWGLIHGSTGLRLPEIRTLAPFAGVFVLYNLLSADLHGTAEAASLVTGFFAGLLLARGVHLRKPPAVRVGVAVAATALFGVVYAVPLRGLTDVRPRVAQLVSVESATAAAYEPHVASFRDGRSSAAELAAVIDKQILPQLQSAWAPLSDLRGVPDQHEPLAIAAQEFGRLRLESWRLRIRGLRKGRMPLLRQADKVERESLDLLQTLHPASK